MPTIPNLYELLSELNESKDYTTDTLSSIRSSINDSESSTSNKDPYSLHEFYKYLKKSHCDENLEFFNKTRRFLISENTLSRSCSIDKNYWNDQVYNKFIMVDSPLQCNFPQYVRDNFDQCYLDDVRPSQADIVNAIEIVMGMLFDAYSRYLNHIQTNDHFSISSETSINTSSQEGEEYEEQSISQYGLDMDKLNRDIKHMTLTNSMSTLTTTTSANNNNNNYTVSKPQMMTLNVKLPTTTEMKRNEKQEDSKQQQSKKNLIMKGKLFFHKFQKNRYSNTTIINDKTSRKKSVSSSSPKGLKRVKSNPITNNNNNTTTSSTSHKHSHKKHSHTHSHTHNLHHNHNNNNKNTKHHHTHAQDSLHHTRSAATSLTVDRTVVVPTNS